MIKILPQNNININKPTFTAKQYTTTNSLKIDTIEISNNEENTTDNNTNVFRKFTKYIKNLFNTENILNDSQVSGEFETEEIYPEEPQENPVIYDENISAEAREILSLNPEMTVEEAEEHAAWNAEANRIAEANIAKDIQAEMATQKPTFSEHTEKELNEMFNKLKDKSPENRQESFNYLIGKTYSELRESGNYTEEESIADDFRKIHPLNYWPEKGVFVYEKDGWFWHSINGCQKLSKDRVSLSVMADDFLLKKLDELLLYGTYNKGWDSCVVPPEKHTKGYYKASSSASDWCKRHDPITIYFDEKVSPEMLDAIAAVTRQYRRTPSRKLPGAIQDRPWMANEPYTTQSQIDSIVEKANEIDRDLAVAIKKYLGNNASTGMYHSCIKLLEDYKRYKQISEN